MLHKNPKPYLIATRFRWDADFFFWENKYFLFILLTFPSASLWRLRGMSDNKRANSLRFFMPGEMWLHTTQCHHTEVVIFSDACGELGISFSVPISIISIPTVIYKDHKHVGMSWQSPTRRQALPTHFSLFVIMLEMLDVRRD